MRLKLPYRILQALLAVSAPAWAQSVSVSSWDDFKAQWDAGERDFVFTQTIVTPENTSTALDPNIDSNVPATSGLFVNTGQSLTIHGNGNVLGSDDHNHDVHSFAIARPIANFGSLNVSDCIFQNNFASATSQMKGGAVYTGDGSVSSFTNCSFIGNHLAGESSSILAGSGGAYFNGTSNTAALVYMARSTFSGCIFEDNFINIKRTSTDLQFTNAEGGALINNADSTVEISGGSCFTRNAAIAASHSNTNAMGGAIFNDGKLIVSDTVFEGNLVRALADADAMQHDYAQGGAVYHNGWRTYGNYMTLTRCLFSGNMVEGAGTNGGGAIFTSAAAGNVSLVDCSFLNNTVAAGLTSEGGAIYHGATNGLFNMVAQTMAVVFRGNKVDYDAVAGSGRANAITFKGGNGSNSVYEYDLRASGAVNALSGEAASILFYDPVEFKQVSPTNFNINRTDGTTEYSGSVVFSGEDFINGNQADRVSTANDKTRLVQHNGVLEIRDGAIVGAASTAAPDTIGAGAYELKKGVLQMTGSGGLLASAFSFNTNNSWKDAILRADSGSRVTASTADFSRGFTFDFNPFINAAPGAGNPHTSGLQVHAVSSLLGGMLGVLDNLTLDYYMNPLWRETQKFLALNFVNPDGTTTGDFDSVMSHKYESNTVDDVHGYQGTWSEEWVTNADGTKELYVVWTPVAAEPEEPEEPENPEEPSQPEQPENPGGGTEPGTPGKPSNPEIREILPELAGDMAMNSMWNTRSNMQSMSSAALGQVGLQRYNLDHAWNYWGQGLGDFDMHRSSGNRDGFDYHGYGYAVGADRRFDESNCVLGVAFGSLYGTSKSRSFIASIDQTSTIGMLYGGWMKEFDKKNVLDVTGSASYGVTSNRLHTYYSDGMQSGGKWHNNAVRLTLNAEWLHDLGNNWTYSAFVGAEYDDVTQKSFTETGDRPRRFGEGKLRNLALPVGMGISKQYGFSDGKVWIHNLRAAYLPDVYRKNPSATATRLTEDGYSWTARGVDMARNAARIEYDTRLIINPTWSVFAGYAVELRKDAVDHNVNLGVSASF